jgi:hypothetical protein
MLIRLSARPEPIQTPLRVVNVVQRPPSRLVLQSYFSPPIAMLLSIKEMEVRKIGFAETWQPGEIDFSDAGVRQAVR